MVYLNASEVAAAIKMNPYKTQKEIILKYLSPVNEKKLHDYAASETVVSQLVIDKGTEEQKRKFDTLDEIKKCDDIDALKFNDPEKQSILDEIKKGDTTIKAEQSAITKEIVTEITHASVNADVVESKKIEKEILKELPDEIKKIATGHVNRTRGDNEETKIIDKYEKDNNTKIRKRNDELYKIELGGVMIYGRIDGYEEGKGLVEVKNRRNRLFGEIPLYEKVQCEVYMMMVDEDECTHIERYGNEDNTTMYESDLDLLKQIKEGLSQYKQRFEKHQRKRRRVN